MRARYIPALGYKILLENRIAKNKINLVGLSIGDGLCDPGLNKLFVLFFFKRFFV